MAVINSIIETGVDRLVKLVKERGKIAIKDAAKQLGVGSTVIEEWVDFLEDEGIISVEHSLTKSYLVGRKLSKKEVAVKAKEFSGKKDVFVKFTKFREISQKLSKYCDICHSQTLHVSLFFVTFLDIPQHFGICFQVSQYLGKYSLDCAKLRDMSSKTSKPHEVSDAEVRTPLAIRRTAYPNVAIFLTSSRSFED